MPTVNCLLAGIVHRLDYNKSQRRDETIVNGILYLRSPFEFSYSIDEKGRVDFRPNNTDQYRIKSILRAIGD